MRCVTDYRLPAAALRLPVTFDGYEENIHSAQIQGAKLGPKSLLKGHVLLDTDGFGFVLARAN